MCNVVIIKSKRYAKQKRRHDSANKMYSNMTAVQLTRKQFSSSFLLKNIYVILQLQEEIISNAYQPIT